MNKYPKHLFHVLEPSYWPLFIAIGLFFFVTGLAFSMHYIINGYYIILLGLLLLVITAIFWFLDISREAVVKGLHTRVVRKGLKTGFLFFIASEIMLFFGFFLSFLSFSFMSFYWNRWNLTTCRFRGYTNVRLSFI